MSKSKAELSITKRVLLDYIKYKTNNNHQFFASNEYIATGLKLTENTAKTFVNDLIRDGYLYKEIDKNGRRILSLTGKAYAPLFEDVSQFDKSVLKQERDNATEENRYLNEQLEFEQGHCEELSTQNTKLVLTNSQLTERVKDLEKRLSNLEKRMNAVEKFFIQQGVGKEKLEEIIQDNIE